MTFDAILASLAGKPVEQPVDTRQWSDEQNTFFDALLNYDHHLLVNAVAGSGKTSTMLEGAIRWCRQSKGGNVLFLAYGKVIADELAQKIPSGLRMQARTIHSFCWRELSMQCRPRIKMELGRVWRILELCLPRIYGNINSDVVLERELEREEAVWIASMCRHTMADPTLHTVRRLMDFHARECTLPDQGLMRVADAAARILSAAGEKVDDKPPSIDFDDMAWFALRRRDFRWPRFALVLVDEAQDLNQAQIEVVMRLKAAGARIVAVGDPDQAIFGWRGALPSAMDILQRRLQAQELPLSVTWRCPAMHVRHVSSIVNRIEARPDAPEGVIRRWHYEDALNEMQAGDLVVGRTNAQVIEQLISFIRQGRPCTMLGTEFGSEMIGFIKRFRAKELPLLRNRAGVWGDAQKRKLQDPQRIQAVDDKLMCLNLLANLVESIEELNELVTRVFSDTANAVRFSTVHRAKGLEADRVMICPGPLTLPAKQMWQRRQERNLRYVALTRARSELYLTADPDIEEQDVARGVDDSLPDGADPRYGW